MCLHTDHAWSLDVLVHHVRDCIQSIWPWGSISLGHGIKLLYILHVFSLKTLILNDNQIPEISFSCGGKPPIRPKGVLTKVKKDFPVSKLPVNI